MIACRRGDVVLVDFVFPDESGIKRRPAVIVSSDAYNQARRETIIAAITSNTDRILYGDCAVSDWQKSGLLFPSVVTGIVRTIKQDMVSRRLGTMSKADLEAVQEDLRLALDL